MKFATQSAMMLHLEIGTCPSGVDWSDIDEYARECRQSRAYLGDDDDDDDYMYKCPTCEKPFRFMSAVLQHAESEPCSEDLSRWSGPLAIFLRFLEARVP